MRAWHLEGSFGLENMRRVEVERPVPGAEEALVRLQAVSLNARDLMMVEGSYNPRQPLPLVPCSDGAGVVEAVGEAVSELAPGDSVCPLFAPFWMSGEPARETMRATLGGPMDGTLREYLVLPASSLVQFPGHLEPVEAATLPCAALTAWSALVTHGGIGEGDTVLVQGTGGVSIFALQIANLLGARVVITSSSDTKLERARQLGAWETVNYVSEPRWGRRVRQLTGGGGVDHVVEVGGSSTFSESLQAVRVGGTISSIGIVGAREGVLSVVPIFMRQLRIQGILVGHRESFEAMSRAFDQHRLAPVVDRVFPFEEAPEAMRFLASGGHFGKVCIEI